MGLQNFPWTMTLLLVVHKRGFAMINKIKTISLSLSLQFLSSPMFVVENIVQSKCVKAEKDINNRKLGALTKTQMITLIDEYVIACALKNRISIMQ